MWCQNNMESKPATLKISEKARKYHFFPRKSILVLRKNSTGLFSPLSIYDLARSSDCIIGRLCHLKQSPNHEITQLFNSLNAERFSTLLPAEHPVENETRHKNRGEQVREQTESERGRESFHRTGTKDE